MSLPAYAWNPTLVNILLYVPAGVGMLRDDKAWRLFNREQRCVVLGWLMDVGQKILNIVR